VPPNGVLEPGTGGGEETCAAHQGERQQFLDGDARDVRDHDTVAS
jgi:hypothetical protein